MVAATKDGPPGISVVLPAYNEEPNVAQAIAAATTAMQSIGADCEIIVVDDGSRDATASVVEGLVPSTPTLRLVMHPVNRGYGGALRSGFAAATKDWIMLNASDNQFVMDEIVRFLPLMPTADLICGYRGKNGVRKGTAEAAKPCRRPQTTPGAPQKPIDVHYGILKTPSHLNRSLLNTLGAPKRGTGRAGRGALPAKTGREGNARARGPWRASA